MAYIILFNQDRIPVYIFSTEINEKDNGLAKIIKVPNIVVLSLLKEILIQLGENVMSSTELSKFDKISEYCRDILVYSIHRDAEIFIVNFYNDGNIKQEDADFVQMLLEDYSFSNNEIEKIKTRNELIYTPSANKIDIKEDNGIGNNTYAMYYNSLIDMYNNMNMYNNQYIDRGVIYPLGDNQCIGRSVIYPLDDNWITIDYKWINLFNY